jgi:hypothetical protein
VSFFSDKEHGDSSSERQSCQFRQNSRGDTNEFTVITYSPKYVRYCEVRS